MFTKNFPTNTKTFSYAHPWRCNIIQFSVIQGSDSIENICASIWCHLQHNLRPLNSNSLRVSPHFYISVPFHFITICLIHRFFIQSSIYHCLTNFFSPFQAFKCIWQDLWIPPGGCPFHPTSNKRQAKNMHQHTFTRYFPMIQIIIKCAFDEHLTTQQIWDHLIIMSRVLHVIPRHNYGKPTTVIGGDNYYDNEYNATLWAPLLFHLKHSSKHMWSDPCHIFRFQFRYGKFTHNGSHIFTFSSGFESDI